MKESSDITFKVVLLPCAVIDMTLLKRQHKNTSSAIYSSTIVRKQSYKAAIEFFAYSVVENYHSFSLFKQNYLVLKVNPRKQGVYLKL